MLNPLPLDILPEPIYYRSAFYRKRRELMKMRNGWAKIDLVQGTLDMLLLRTLLFGPRHRHGTA
jgi:hypothetical protein